LQLFDASEFEISALQFPTHYPPEGNGDVLDIVVHKNIRISNFTVSDILSLKRGPLNLVSTTEELLERKRSGSSPENREFP
jgi:hypothetical protein